MANFRIATLNVHGFDDPSTYKNNIARLISILKPLDLDLIAVEEIADDQNWIKFCRELSLPHFIFGEAEGTFLGNGIASRYPILSHSNQQNSFSGEGGRRGLLHCSLDGDHPFIKDRIFAVTHLDHLDEYDRLKQMKEFNPLGNNINILMGDMNSLTRDDYSNNYYRKHIVELRDKTGWEKPCFDLTQLITNQWSFQDAFKQINPQLKDEQVATCRYRTRIDYIYLHFRHDDQWILKDCFNLDMQNATDHNAVVAVFEQKTYY